MQKNSSYDDLVREIVPLPDSSYRPSLMETVAAENRPPGLRITTGWPDDRMPSMDAIRAVLEGLGGADLSDLDVVLDGGRAILEGSIAHDDDRHRIMHALSTVHGVEVVIDTLRLRL